MDNNMQKQIDGNIRKAVYAESFYPANKKDLMHTIENFINKVKKDVPAFPNKSALKALIFPHAGYIYSGRTAAYCVSFLKKEEFKDVILIGPDHKIGFRNCCVSITDGYKTPFGTIRLNKEKTAKLLSHKKSFRYIKESDAAEHSLEVVLPFLQFQLQEFKLTPIVMGYGNIFDYADAIDQIIDNNSLIAVSADLSHYLNYDSAVVKDKKTIKNILEFNVEQLKEENSSCGILPILTLIEIAKKNNWQPILLNYSNSGDTAGNKNHVVGYAAIAFYRNTQEKFNKKEALLKLARNTIEKKFRKIDNKQFNNLLKQLEEEKTFNKTGGTFVTLYIDNNLRGCIGNIISDKSIIEGIKNNAINAAFKDPRFPSLVEEELDKIKIEISLLTEPKPLEYLNPDDLIAKLKRNIDGVILRKGIKSATFLPQVWEQLPNQKQFLSNLCVKAGLSSDAWITDKLDIFIYKVNHFQE